MSRSTTTQPSHRPSDQAPSGWREAPRRGRPHSLKARRTLPVGRASLRLRRNGGRSGQARRADRETSAGSQSAGLDAWGWRLEAGGWHPAVPGQVAAALRGQFKQSDERSNCHATAWALNRPRQSPLPEPIVRTEDLVGPTNSTLAYRLFVPRGQQRGSRQDTGPDGPQLLVVATREHSTFRDRAILSCPRLARADDVVPLAVEGVTLDPNLV